MIFAEYIQRSDTYGLLDVFGRDKIYYEDSTIRVAGWETPVSFIYAEGNDIKIRFKKEIEQYAAGFEDEPFECHPMFNDSAFYDILVRNYSEEQPIRCLNYAIRQYKKAQKPFAPKKLSPKELTDKLLGEELSQVAYSLGDEYGLFDAGCYWFPVDVDAILIDFADRQVFSKEEAFISHADGVIMAGHVGYDGKFYRKGDRRSPNCYKVYSLKNGLRLEEPPGWFSAASLCGTHCWFLKDHIVTRDHRCYDYTGAFLEEKTKHYKNIALLNDLITHLWKSRSSSHYSGPYTRLMVPKNFLTLTLDDIERVVAPHLASKKALNAKALERLGEVKKIIKMAGLQNDFEAAYRNIIDLNRSKIYGGSLKNICGEKLAANLRKLHKKVGTEAFAHLLKNEVELKKAVAQLNGVTIVDYVVAALDFSLIKNERRVPKALKKDAFWCALEPGTLVVFSCNSAERFCAVTTSTKAGLGLNRV